MKNRVNIFLLIGFVLALLSTGGVFVYYNYFGDDVVVEEVKEEVKNELTMSDMSNIDYIYNNIEEVDKFIDAYDLYDQVVNGFNFSTIFTYSTDQISEDVFSKDEVYAIDFSLDTKLRLFVKRLDFPDFIGEFEFNNLNIKMFNDDSELIVEDFEIDTFNYNKEDYRGSVRYALDMPWDVHNIGHNMLIEELLDLKVDDNNIILTKAVYIENFNTEQYVMYDFEDNVIESFDYDGKNDLNISDFEMYPKYDYYFNYIDDNESYVLEKIVRIN